jgi:hypothetical protein
LGEICVNGDNHSAGTVGLTIKGDTNTLDTGDILNISDAGSVAANAYTLTAMTFQRTALAATSTITYLTIETLNIETGSGSNTVTVTNTAAAVNTTITTQDMADIVNVTDTGVDSNVIINTAGGGDAITISDTGIDGGDANAFGSFLEVNGGDEIAPAGDSITLIANGVASRVRLDGEGGDDVLNVRSTATGSRTQVNGDAGNDTINVSSDAPTNMGNVNGIAGELTIDGGNNGPSTRNIYTGADVGQLFGCPATPTPLVLLGPAPFAQGDTLTISDAGEAVAHKYMIDGDSVVRRDGSPTFATVSFTVDYTAIEELELSAGSANDVVEVDMAAAGSLPSVVAFDGGGQMGAGVNAGDMFKVFGTAGDDNMLFGPITADPGPRRPFEVNDVEFIKGRGLAGNDDIINDTPARSLLEGNAGNDILVGGPDIDILAGGGGQDYLSSRGGNDFLFADVDLLSTSSGIIIDDDAAGQGDFVDGGANTDSAAQRGPCDRVDNIEGTLIDGGGQKNVITWLQAQIAALNNASVDALIAAGFAALQFDWGLPTTGSSSPPTNVVQNQQPIVNLNNGTNPMAEGDTPFVGPLPLDGRGVGAAPTQAQPAQDDLCPYFDNWGGRNEKWVKDANGRWYFILPNGEMYLADNNEQATGTKTADVGPAVYANPSMLFDDTDVAAGEGEVGSVDAVFTDHGDDLIPPLLNQIQPWRNPLDKFDVNHDGYRTALDALIIINEINRRAAAGESNVLGDPSSSGAEWFFDVSNDNNVSAIDVLTIINSLNENVPRRP